MKLVYYPGCTVKSTAKDYEYVALKVLERLGIEAYEIENWTCCGVVPGLSEDVPVHNVAPIRNLIRAQEFAKKNGLSNIVFSLCSMCYHTLKHADLKYKKNLEIAERLSRYITDEPSYEQNMDIRHVLDVLYRIVGLEKIKSMVKKPLEKLEVGAFYGCLLLRPREIAIDDSEDPVVIEEILLALGAQPIDYPYRNECCGSYNVVRTPEAVWKVSSKILQSAYSRGARVIVTTCPLCYFNLDEARKRDSSGKRVELFYLAELMAYAFGMEEVLPEPKREKIRMLLARKL